MRYFIGFLIVIGLIVLVFVLFLTGGSKTPQKATPSLPGYANTSVVVRMTIDGPITAEQTHRSVQVTVGQSESNINVIQGYQNTVLNHQGYASNSSAYNNFLYALGITGFTKTRKTSQTNVTGTCPFGDRYIFQIIDGANDIQNTWSTSCGGQGTFGGNLSQTVALFQNQIPDYATITSGVNIIPQSTL